MKTLLFTLEYPPFRGGVANYYGYLSKYWPIGEKILVLDNNKKELLKKGQIPAWSPAYFSLKRKVRLSNIDYILVGQILPLGTVVYLFSLFRPIKYAVFLHGMDFNYALRGRKRFLTRLILKKADKIICANSYLANKVEEFKPHWSQKIYSVNPGVESGIPEPDRGEAQRKIEEYHLAGKTVLFSLGRLVKRKGVDMTIKALAKLPPETLDKIVYVVAGEGPDEGYLLDLVPDELRGKIYFLGKIREEEKWLWFKLADIFVMPSRKITDDFEGFGIVYLEANLLGKPVIAGDSGGVRDAVKHNYNGLLVNPDSVEEIKDAILTLINDQELRAELGRRGRARVLKDFSWEVRAEKISQIIKK